MSDIVPIGLIERSICMIRDSRVMLDVDLASIYGVSTKRLCEQVKRNLERFPSDFMFTLTKAEKDQLVANCDRFKNLKHSTVLPHAFTEYGAVMLANILRSPKAVQASIQIVRTFIRLRELLSSHKQLAIKLKQLEGKYDSQFRVVFDAIRRLMEQPPLSIKHRIGF